MWAHQCKSLHLKCAYNDEIVQGSLDSGVEQDV